MAMTYRKSPSEWKRSTGPAASFIYQSGVTQLLGFIVEKATGEKLSDYVSRKLWTPMHAEESALRSLDRKDGMEKAYCCFNSNARDFARFGQLLLNNGQWDGQQLISPLSGGSDKLIPSYGISANPTIVTDSNTGFSITKSEDPLYERNLETICLHASRKAPWS